MWIINFLPDWVFHLIFFVGVVGTLVGFVLGMIPLVKQYVIPIRVISLFALCLGLFLEGGIADNQAWQIRVKELEVKVAQAEAESAKVNTVIIEKAVVKVAKQKEKTLVVKQYIDREVTKYDNQCVIPKEFIKAHNDAAEQAK
jgi:hypothetical protein